MVSQLGEGGVPVHLSLNACLTPICAVDRCHVTTVEGIGGIAQVKPSFYS